MQILFQIGKEWALQAPKNVSEHLDFTCPERVPSCDASNHTMPATFLCH
jgi:hypothetical protein